MDQNWIKPMMIPLTYLYQISWKPSLCDILVLLHRQCDATEIIVFPRDNGVQTHD